MLASIPIVMMLAATSAFAQNSCSTSIGSNCSGTSLASGNCVWFNVTINPTTPISSTCTTNIYCQNQSISFTANGQTYNCSVPNSQITFSPSCTTSTTAYNSSTNTWVTTIPACQASSGNAFMCGVAFQVPACGVPGGINPGNWSGSFSCDQQGVGLTAQCSASAYKSLSSDCNELGINPVNNSNISNCQNSNAAGCPENFGNCSIGGGNACGGGSVVWGGCNGGNQSGNGNQCGSGNQSGNGNQCGSGDQSGNGNQCGGGGWFNGGGWYGNGGGSTGSNNPSNVGTGQLVITTKETPDPNLETRSDTPYDVKATYTVTDPSAKLYLTRTWQVRSPNNVFGTVTQDPSSPYSYSISQTGSTQTQDLGSFSPMVQYGLETWTLSYGPANNSSQPIVLDTKQVYIYPKSAATISNALSLGSSPTSLASSYQGDTPRVQVEIDKSYPGGTTWVAFYSGTVPSAPPVAIAPISNSSYTTSTGDLNAQRFVNVDVGNLIQSSGTYSIQVIQNTGAYGAESLAAATFNINPNYQVTSEVGLTK